MAHGAGAARPRQCSHGPRSWTPPVHKSSFQRKLRQLHQVNYSVEVTFPANSSTNKAGLVLAHDGDDSFYAVVLDP